jgi:hypothetical protein
MDASGDGDGSIALDPNGDPPVCTHPNAPSTNPKALGDVAGALSADARTFVVFGGDSAVPPCPQTAPVHAFEGDTYVLDVACGAWTKLAADGAPPKRSRHAMATDPDRNRALLFGGRVADANGAYKLFADVWAFDFATQAWSEVQTSGTAPPGRANTAIGVDVAGHQLVVFGGNASTSGLSYTPLDDTWALDLESGAWRRLAATGTKPSARLFHAMAMDQQARVAYVFAGGDANALQGPFLTDVWALDLASESWSKVATKGASTGGRINHALAFDAPSKRLVTFAGHDDGAIGNENDLYVLDLATTPSTWTRLPHGDTAGKPATDPCTFPPDFTNIDKQSPERRSAFAFGARVDGRGFVVFGGKGDCGVLADAWWWSDGSGAWTSAKLSPVGLSCLRVQTTCNGLCG